MGSKPTRHLTETRLRAKLFDAELCQNIKTAEGVAWPKLKSTHRMNLAKLVPLPDKTDPSQDQGEGVTFEEAGGLNAVVTSVQSSRTQ